MSASRLFTLPQTVPPTDPDLAPSRLAYTRWDRKRVLYGAATVFVSLALGAISRHIQPELWQGREMLFFDSGVSPYIADRLMHGAKLYQDITYPYGPLPAYLYTAFALLFGNTISTYTLWSQCTSALCLALVFAFLSRHIHAGWAALFTLVCFLPVMQVPGGLQNIPLTSAYVPLERLAMLALLLLWRPAPERSTARLVSMGIVLGLWQTVKFGGAAFGFGAVAVVDVLTLWFTGAAVNRQAVLALARQYLPLLLGGCAIEALYLVWAYSTLPVDIASDLVLPAYVALGYQGLMRETGYHRFPYIAPVDLNPRSFLRLYLLYLLSFLIASVGFAALIWNRLHGRMSSSAAHLAPWIGLMFYYLGATSYLGHEYHFLQYAWLMMLPVPLVVVSRAGWQRIALAMALSFPFVGICHVAELGLRHGGLSAGWRAWPLPNGEEVFVTDEEASGLQKLSATLHDQGIRPDDPGARGKLLIVSNGAGFYTFWGAPPFLRNVWYLPLFMRPRDERQFVENAGALRVVVFARQVMGLRPGQTPQLSRLSVYMQSEAAGSAIRARVKRDFVPLGHDMWLLRLE